MRSTSSATVGRSSSTPTTCPLDITPRSGRPSTIAALSSIGVFAAMTTWLHERSFDFRMARPSRSMSRHDVPESFLNRSALRIARGRLVTALVWSSFSVKSVRSTRWGTPSTCVVTMVSVTDFAR
jgi:hypothetical protein